MPEKMFINPMTGMMHLICNGSRFGLDLQDHAEIIKLLDDAIISSINKNEEGYFCETYAKVFVNAKPYDSGYCGRVRMQLANKEEMMRLNAEMRKTFYNY